MASRATTRGPSEGPHGAAQLRSDTYAIALLAGALVIGLPRASTAADCPGRDDAIATDRPSVTNSSLVVPFGSVQAENGANWTVNQTVRTFDGSETRIRVGAFHCGELLVDAPNYIRSLTGVSSSEFSGVVISAKRQLFERSTSFGMSVITGLGVPGLGNSAADRGYTPYIQFPWSRSIVDGWSVNGMVTVRWSTVANTTLESTLGLGREVGRRASVFVEYIVDHTSRQAANQIIDGGGSWQLKPKQQVDFRIGVGLASTSPRYYAGVGYSLRIDGIFAGHERRDSP
jgi:hypothetical protein